MDLSSNINNMVDMAANSSTSVNSDAFKKKADAAVAAKDDKALMDACKQFETYFINQMMKEMRNTLSQDDDEETMIPKSKGETMFTEMRDEKYAEKASDDGGIGIAKMLYNQLKLTSAANTTIATSTDKTNSSTETSKS